LHLSDLLDTDSTRSPSVHSPPKAAPQLTFPRNAPREAAIDRTNRYGQAEVIDRDQVIATLRICAPELKAAGVESLSLFGSTATGEVDPGDVDVAVRLAKAFSTGGSDDFYQLNQ
jgi:hypothetical protein